MMLGLHCQRSCSPQPNVIRFFVHALFIFCKKKASGTTCRVADSGTEYF